MPSNIFLLIAGMLFTTIKFEIYCNSLLDEWNGMMMDDVLLSSLFILNRVLYQFCFHILPKFSLKLKFRFNTLIPPYVPFFHGSAFKHNASPIKIGRKKTNITYLHEKIQLTVQI